MSSLKLQVQVRWTTDWTQLTNLQQSIRDQEADLEKLGDPKAMQADYDAKIAKAKADLAAARAKSEDEYAIGNLGRANGAVDQQANAWLADWEKKMDGWMDTAGHLSEEEKKARDNLARLKDEAAAAAAAAKEDDKKKPPPSDLTPGQQSAISGTFSGAVAGMLGGGGNPAIVLAQQQVDALHEAAKDNRKKIQLMEEQRDKLRTIDQNMAKAAEMTSGVV